jgi:hypothetical protein
MNCIMLLMNVLRFAAVLAMLLKASCHGPAVQSCKQQTLTLKVFDLRSLKDHPPTLTQVCNPDFFSLSLVNLLRSSPAFLSIGIISNVVGWKNTKAKFRCVKPSKLRSSGDTELHFLVLAQDS